jgi:uncharacterized membrane protein
MGTLECRCAAVVFEFLLGFAHVGISVLAIWLDFGLFETYGLHGAAITRRRLRA